jgi:hypothetical protein
MPAIPRRNRPLPGTRRDVLDGLGERSPEHLLDLARCLLPQLMIQQERIAQLGGGLVRCFSMQTRQRLLCVPFYGRSAPVVVEIHIGEREARGDAVAFTVLLEERRQLGIGGGTRRGQILRQELELPRQAPPDNGVITIQSQRQRLTVQHLLTDVRLEQPMPFPHRGRPLPCQRPGQSQAFEVTLGNHDAPRYGSLQFARLEHRLQPEQRGADDQEVQQWFLAQGLQGCSVRCLLRAAPWDAVSAAPIAHRHRFSTDPASVPEGHPAPSDP